MNTALVKPSKEIKDSTSLIRAHTDAMARAWDIYLAQIKRAQADYVERTEKAREMFLANGGTEPTTPPAEQTPTPSAGHGPTTATTESPTI